MPRPSVIADPETGQFVLPARVPANFDIDFCARALAIAHGRPNRKVGKHRVRQACLDLAAQLIYERYVPDVPAEVIEAWRRYLVEDLAEFPPEAIEVDAGRG